MACFYRPQLNHLWSIWYGIFVSLFHAYLIYLGLTRYQLYTDLKWTEQESTDGLVWGPKRYPGVYLNIYIILHFLAIFCLLFFLGFSVFKVGNLANDNEKLGARSDKTILLKGGGNWCSRIIKSSWLHGPPAAQTIHLLMAFVLLISQQLILGEIHNRKHMMRREEIWNTELDFIYQHSDLLGRTLPVNASYLKHLPESRAVGIKLLPILVNEYSFGIPLEFLNYFIALCAYMVSYPSVFWRASKPFSLLFSVHLFIHVLAAIYSYIGFSLLHRINLYNFEHFLGHVEAPFIIHNRWILLGAYVLAMVTFYLAPASLYGYGYNRFSSCWINQRNRSLTAINESQQRETNRLTCLPKTQATGSACCEGYGPHISAIGLLIIMVILKSPIIYDIMVLYNQHQMRPLILSCAVIDVVYLFTWILLWLGLTLKRNWNFKVTYNVQELVTLLQVDRPVERHHQRDGEHDNDYKNAMLLVCGEEIYITDDNTAKGSLIKIAQRFGMGPTTEDIYWLKPAHPGSPMNRREGSEKASPETARLLLQRRPSDDQRFTTNPVYQRIDNPYGSPQSRMGGSSLRLQPQQMDHQRDMISTFGTMPRSDPRLRHRDVMQSSDGGVREFHYSSRPPLPMQTQDNYASIHKPRPNAMAGMDSTNDYIRLAQSPITTETASTTSRGSSYANLNPTMQPYSTRGPPQARVIAFNNGGSGSNTPRGSTNYGPYASSARAIRQSPTSERSSVPRTGPDIYGRPTPIGGPQHVKLSSFGEINKTPTQELLRQPVNGTPTISQSSEIHDSRETTPQSTTSSATLTKEQQQQHVHWQNNPVYSTVTEQYTPSSTLTSQGSYSLTPTPASPNGNYASIGERPVQKRSIPTPVNAFAHHERNDSANFSWTSSNESAENQGQLATSIV